VSAFDLKSPSWSVERRRGRRGGLWVYSVVEQAGGARYWFGPFKESEIEGFVESRRQKFEQMSQVRAKSPKPADTPRVASAL
jgi:hypothetical protein